MPWVAAFKKMKITDVTARTVSLGVLPYWDGGLRVEHGGYGVVEVFSDEGLSGICPGVFPGVATVSVIEDRLKDVLIGENPLEVERLWQKMFGGWRHPKLDDMIAISVVDIAIWDLIGKALGQPVWRILGGAQSRVKAYGAGGMYGEGKTVEDLVEEMLDLVDQGHRAVKLKVGGAPFDEDVARVKGVREALGPDMGLLVDGNHAWTTYEAIRFARAIEEYHPYWLEEPVQPWDYRGCAQVSAALDMPVATGENLSTRWTFKELIDLRAADIIQADAMYCGGITEWRKIAAYAAVNNLPVAPHGNPYIGAHCVASVTNGLIVECGAYRRKVQDPKPAHHGFLAPLEVKDGYIQMTEKPGLGFEMDRQALDSYLAQG